MYSGAIIGSINSLKIIKCKIYTLPEPFAVCRSTAVSRVAKMLAPSALRYVRMFPDPRKHIPTPMSGDFNICVSRAGTSILENTKTYENHGKPMKSMVFREIRVDIGQKVKDSIAYIMRKPCI